MSNETFIDINDLGLQEEELGSDFNADSNAFAGLPLLPKGKYVGNISLRDKDPGKQFQQKDYKDKGGTYFATKTVIAVTSPDEYAKRRIFDDFVSTGLWSQDTSTIASILHLLGRSPEVTAARTHNDLCRSFAAALASEPLIGVRVDWEGRVKNPDTGVYDDLYKTMTEFKQKDDGTYDPSIKDGEGNEIGRARLKVRGYFAAPQGAASVAG